MGIDLAAVQLLCCAKSIGIDFSRTLMIGRQVINKEPGFIPALQSIGLNPRQIAGIEHRSFAEPLFHLLGANQVTSLDASDYEGATYIHDLNTPLDSAVFDRFSVVFDGGTLEHVFNFPVAIRNCMDCVEIGGHFIQVTTGNNFMGHGLFQFSPELMYRVLSKQNGFVVKAMFLVEVTPTMPWYQVPDPANVKRRIELINRRPLYLCTIAQRTRECQIFSAWPQQSDYVVAWDMKASEISRKKDIFKLIINGLHLVLPRWSKNAVRAMIEIFNDQIAFDKTYFYPITADNLVNGRILSMQSSVKNEVAAVLGDFGPPRRGEDRPDQST